MTELTGQVTEDQVSKPLFAVDARGADFSRCGNLYKANLVGLITDNSTVWPEYFRNPTRAGVLNVDHLRNPEAAAWAGQVMSMELDEMGHDYGQPPVAKDSFVGEPVTVVQQFAGQENPIIADLVRHYVNLVSNAND